MQTKKSFLFTLLSIMYVMYSLKFLIDFKNWGYSFRPYFDNFDICELILFFFGHAQLSPYLKKSIIWLYRLEQRKPLGNTADSTDPTFEVINIMTLWDKQRNKSQLERH